MKSFPMNNQHTKAGKTYRTLDEMGFTDLYIEVPEQDFQFIKAAMKQATQQITNEQQSSSQDFHIYTLFALNHILKLLHKTIRYSH